MPLFDTHIVVDWSARSRPSPAKPTRDAIWWAVARDGVVAQPVYVRTRQAATTRLAKLIAAERAARRRVLVGFDFPFGYPAGVAQCLTGRASAFAIWDWLAARVIDDENNVNNRYAVAAEINRLYPGVGPCWGRPATWPYPDVPTRAHARTDRAAQPVYGRSKAPWPRRTSRSCWPNSIRRCSGRPWRATRGAPKSTTAHRSG